jgi:single-strand selective monofunctional uracil DNA glycosylase
MNDFSLRLAEIYRRLSQKTEEMTFTAPAVCRYNPLDYARAPFKLYLEKYGNSRKRILFLGMNPGPWGMAQTGIPFGEVPAVRTWLGIEAPVNKPVLEHPKKPVLGFECGRSEVSGRRLWGLFAKRFGTAETFFKDHFVANYCPLVFMAESGTNVTPDKLSLDERVPLFEVCDRALADTIRVLGPEWVVGIGQFAEKRVLTVKERYFSTPAFSAASILHPSPASPAANRGWEDAAVRKLQSLGFRI